MRKIISFMHMSLDGFVAGPNGEMNWIKVNEEIFTHVGQRIERGDTALYGRVTYDMMEGYWPTAGDQPNASKHDKDHSRWYAHVRKLVLSNSMKDSSDGLTHVINGDITAQLNKIRQGDGEDILVFGSPTATHVLMELGLIDGYWLFVNPIILGEGIRLFVPAKEQTQLNLLSTRTFACGVTELNYVVAR